jgi:dTDP-glucose 4,6-dehydratase
LRYAIDSRKIEQDLGWAPRVTFEAGLRQTIQWYLDHRVWVKRVRTGEYQRWVRQHYGNG